MFNPPIYFCVRVVTLLSLVAMAGSLPPHARAPVAFVTQEWPEASEDSLSLRGLMAPDHQEDTYIAPDPPLASVPAPSPGPSPVDALLSALRLTLSEIEKATFGLRREGAGPPDARPLTLRRQLLSDSDEPPGHTPPYPGYTPDADGYYDAAPDEDLARIAWP